VGKSVGPYFVLKCSLGIKLGDSRIEHVQVWVILARRYRG
jgi:hypothetical protein